MNILYWISFASKTQTTYYATCPPPGLWLAFAREPILKKIYFQASCFFFGPRPTFPTWTGCSRGLGRERCPRRSGSLELLCFLVNIWQAPFTLKLNECRKEHLHNYKLFHNSVRIYFPKKLYESIATVRESRVWWRADFQSGSRVLKKVFWTFSCLYLRHTM